MYGVHDGQIIMREAAGIFAYSSNRLGYLVPLTFGAPRLQISRIQCPRISERGSIYGCIIRVVLCRLLASGTLYLGGGSFHLPYASLGGMGDISTSYIHSPVIQKNMYHEKIQQYVVHYGAEYHSMVINTPFRHK